MKNDCPCGLENHEICNTCPDLCCGIYEEEKDMIEVDLHTETRYVGGITIDDMVKTFGRRIKRAVYYDEKGKPEGLISVRMVKLMRWWKFWNKDIRIAYDKYTGLILVPWTIEYGEPEIHYNANIDWESLEKEELQRYLSDTVNENYSPLKIVRDDDGKND